MDQRPGRYHFGVQPCMPGQQPSEVTVVPVCPVKHGRNAHTPRPRISLKSLAGGGFERILHQPVFVLHGAFPGVFERSVLHSVLHV